MSTPSDPALPELHDPSSSGLESEPLPDWLTESEQPSESDMPDWFNPDLLAASLEIPSVAPHQPTEEPESVAQASVAPVSPSALARLRASEENAPSAEAPIPEPISEPEPGSAAPRIERIAPRQTRPQVVTYGIALSLSKKSGHSDILVEHDLPEGVEVVGAKPPARKRGRKLTWSLPTAPVDARFLVHIRAQPGQQVVANGLATFRVSYRTTKAHQTRYARPRLACALTGPESLIVGEAGTLRLVVRNDGDGPTGRLQLQWALPESVRSQRELPEIDLGELQPGEEVAVELGLVAQQEGACDIAVRVVGEKECEARASHALRVTVRGLNLRAPARIQGTSADVVSWEVSVSNPGSAPTSGIRVVGQLPPGLEVDKDAGDLTWHLDQLQAGQTQTWTVPLRAACPGDYFLSVQAECNDGLRAECRTIFECEVVDGATLLDEFFAPAVTEEPAVESRHRVERSNTTTGQNLVFSLAGANYALPLANVLEVGRAPEVFPVPNTPDWLLGVANLRGDIISLVDLRMFFRLDAEHTSPERRLVVVRSSNEEITVGLIVDRLAGIRVARAEEERSRLVSDVQDYIAPYLRGLEESNDRLLLVLDPDRLLLSSEMRQFETL